MYLARVQPEVRSHEHGDDGADDDYRSRYLPTPATPLARVERVQAGRVMAVRGALTFVSPAPVPLFPVLETQISTLRVRPSTRPNDRFLERSPLTLLAGETSPWPERAPPGKPNTARVSTPPLCRCLQAWAATRGGSGSRVRVGLFLQRHRGGSEDGALALHQTPLGVVCLDHHRKLEPVALGGKGARLLLPDKLCALDAKGSLQLPDPAPHLEPPTRRQAQVGALVWSLEGIDPCAPQPGLKDLAPELLFVPKLHITLFRFSRNLPSSIRKLHRLPAVRKGIMSPMQEDPTLTPWRRLGEPLEGSFAARARGLLAPDFAILGGEGEEIGSLEIHGARGAELGAGELEARIERSTLSGYTMLTDGAEILTAQPLGAWNAPEIICLERLY